MGDKKDRKLNANYAYNSQKEPKRPMGEGSFANMPEKEMFIPYGQPESYRDGIINTQSVQLQDVSKLNENRRFNEGKDSSQKEVSKNRYPGDWNKGTGVN